MPLDMPLLGPDDMMLGNEPPPMMPKQSVADRLRQLADGNLVPPDDHLDRDMRSRNDRMDRPPPFEDIPGGAGIMGPGPGMLDRPAMGGPGPGRRPGPPMDIGPPMRGRPGEGPPSLLDLPPAFPIGIGGPDRGPDFGPDFGPRDFGPRPGGNDGRDFPPGRGPPGTGLN